MQPCPGAAQAPLVQTLPGATQAPVIHVIQSAAQAPVVVDMSRCRKGICSVDTPRSSSGFIVHTAQFFNTIFIIFLTRGGQLIVSSESDIR